MSGKHERVTRTSTVRRWGAAVTAGVLGLTGAAVSVALPATAGAAPVTVTQSANPSPVASGSELTYTLLTKNTGGAKVDNVVLTDVFNGLTSVDGVGALVISTNVGTCTQSASSVRCDAPSLAGGQTWTVTVRGKVTSASGETLNNTTTVTGTKSAQTFSVSSTLATQVVGSGSTALADLLPAITAPSATPPGSDFLQQVTINNKGKANATNVAFTATLAGGGVFQATEPTSLFACDVTSPTTVTCTGGAVNAGANATIRLGVLAPGSAPAPGVTLTVAVDPFDAIAEGDELNNRVQYSTAITAAPPADALALTKVDGPDPIAPYQTLKYTSTVTNTSAYRADYITFTDGTQGLEASSVTVKATATGTPVQPTCRVAAPTVSCDITRFAPSAVMTVEIQGVVVASPGTTIINTATVNGNIKNTGLTSNASTITTVRPYRDFTITQARTFPAPPLPVRAADRFDYTLVAGNSGLVAGSNVLVRQPLPAGVVFDEVAFGAQPGVSCAVDVDNVLSCTIASLPGISAAKPQGDTFTWRITLIAPQSTGPITSTATIDPLNSLAENDESNNTVVTTTPVLTGIDLTVAVKQDFNPIARNGTQRYTVTVPNLGTQNTSGVKVLSTLPAGSRFRTASGDHAFTCSASGQLVTCLGGIIRGTYSGKLTLPVDVATITIDVFAQDEPGNAHFETRVDPDGTVDEIREDNNLALLDGQVGDGVAAGSYVNLKALPITVNLPSGTPPVVATSGNLTYTVPVVNTGSADAYQVVGTFSLPPGSTFLNAKDTAAGPGDFTCSASGQLVTCVGATLLASPSAGRAFSVQVLAPATPGLYTAQSTFDPSNAIGESGETDNKAEHVVKVESGSVNNVYNDLLIKSITIAQGDSIVPDGQATFRVTVENANAQNDAFGVEFKATLPTGSRFRGADDQGGTSDAFSCRLVDDSVVSCTGAKIPAGGARVVDIAVFAPSQPGSYRLDAFVDSTGSIAEGNEGNNAAEKSFAVAFGGAGSYVDLQVQSLLAKKLSDPATTVTQVQPGETFLYEVTVKNTGPGDAINVPFRFVAPSGVQVVDAAPVDDASNFSCTFSSSTVNCTGGYLKPSSADPRVILVKAKAPLTHNVELRATAALDPGNEIPEDSEVNNLASLKTAVLSLIDLTVTNGWTGGTSGQATTFTASVTNNKQGAGEVARDVVVRISAPIGTILEDARVEDAGDDWSCSVYENPVNQVVCTGTELPSTETRTFTIKAFVTSKSGPTSSTTVADPDDLVVETSEGNNSAQGTSS